MLFKFGLVDSPLRYFCNEELETLDHFLFHREKVNTYWTELNTILKSQDLQSWTLLRFWGVSQFTQVQPLPSPHKQCWTGEYFFI